MTLRSSLARYLRGLLEEPIPTPSDPPRPNRESIPPTMTRSTNTSPAISAADQSMIGLMETMMTTHQAEIREIRGMVMDILQGREVDPSRLPPAPEAQPSRMQFDPPDYDAPGTEDLPPGLQSIFEREQLERDDVRKLRTEQEVLAQQLDEARAQLMDPQGPDFEPF